MNKKLLLYFQSKPPIREDRPFSSSSTQTILTKNNDFTTDLGFLLLPSFIDKPIQSQPNPTQSKYLSISSLFLKDQKDPFYIFLKGNKEEEKTGSISNSCCCCCCSSLMKKMPEIIEIEEVSSSSSSVQQQQESSSSSSSDQKILFGKYEVGRLLGCGAFAKVYYARNIQTGQSVAIKSISKQKILKGGLMPNIKREITIMRRLRHPYIVKLHEVLATRTKIYFVMEFVKGGELFTKIAKCRFSEDLSRRYFQQLISAIGYCHSNGVFHRDLKPENLLLDERGDLKVSDFGLSAVTSQIRNDGMLHTLCGTPAYVAPEILTKKGYDGAKVDIWSCGIILFVLNAGYLPFNDPNLMAMYKKIYKGEYRCPKWTSPDLRRFLSRLLDTNPDTRITVEEILRDPWFKKGYREVKFHQEEEEEQQQQELIMLRKEEGSSSSTSSSNKFLNAFDIISYSSGFDLSGLFVNEFGNNNSAAAAAQEGERFISTEEPEKIIKLVEELAMKENLSVRRRGKEWKLVLEGRNGKKLVGMEVYRLTENLAVVEVRSNCDDGIWKEKFSNTPEMRNLVYHPPSSSGN